MLTHLLTVRINFQVYEYEAYDSVLTLLQIKRVYIKQGRETIIAYYRILGYVGLG